MQLKYALDILKKLANGRHPANGEMLPPDNLYNHAQVVRALHASIVVIEDSVKTEARKRNQPANVGKPWISEDEDQLCTKFENGRSVVALAKEFKRTQGGVRARLIRLGKIEADDNTYRNHLNNVGNQAALTVCKAA